MEPFVLDVFAEPANQMPLVLVVVVGDLHFKPNRINSVVLVGSSPPAFLLGSHIAKSKKMQWISSQNGSGHQTSLPALPPWKAGILFSLRTAWYLLTESKYLEIVSPHKFAVFGAYVLIYNKWLFLPFSHLNPNHC